MWAFGLTPQLFSPMVRAEARLSACFSCQGIHRLGVAGLRSGLSSPGGMLKYVCIAARPPYHHFSSKQHLGSGYGMCRVRYLSYLTLKIRHCQPEFGSNLDLFPSDAT